MSIFTFYHNYFLFHNKIKILPEEEAMEEAKFEELAEEEGAVDIMGLKIIILITIKRNLSFIMFCPH